MLFLCVIFNPTKRLINVAYLAYYDIDNTRIFEYRKGSKVGSFSENDIIEIIYCTFTRSDSYEDFKLYVILKIDQDEILTIMRVPDYCLAWSKNGSFSEYSNNIFKNVNSEKVKEKNTLFFWWM